MWNLSYFKPVVSNGETPDIVWGHEYVSCELSVIGHMIRRTVFHYHCHTSLVNDTEEPREKLVGDITAPAYREVYTYISQARGPTLQLEELSLGTSPSVVTERTSLPLWSNRNRFLDSHLTLSPQGMQQMQEISMGKAMEMDHEYLILTEHHAQKELSFAEGKCGEGTHIQTTNSRTVADPEPSAPRKGGKTCGADAGGIFLAESRKRRMVVLFTVLTVMLVVLPRQTSAELFQPGSVSLHYTTAGERREDGTRQMPGVYSGKLVASVAGSAGPSINTSFVNLRKLDFGCTQVDNTVHSGLHIKSISFDKNTQEVIIVEDNAGRVDVLHGHMCHVQRNPCVGMPEWSKLPCILCKIDTGSEGLLGPFNVHNHTVYFTYIPEHVDHHSQLKHHKVIQLRMLTGCESKYPIYNHLDVKKCSKLLASYTSRSHHLQPAADLTVMELGDSRLFLTQARTYDWDNPARTNYNHVGMILVGFHKVYRQVGFRVHLFHSTKLPLHYLDLSLSNIGGIDVFMNTVCWSMFDHIQCGRMIENGRKLGNKTMVVEPGRAQTVCSGDQKNLTTGVAIVNANQVKEVTLVFGCVADRMSEGGMAVAHLTTDQDGKKDVELYEATDRIGPVMAGSMFITRKVSCMTSLPAGQSHSIHRGGATSNVPLGFLVVVLALVNVITVSYTMTT